MKKETFKVLKMDCPSEEQMIRMKLEPHEEIKKLEFDIPNRTLIVYHDGKTETINESVAQLNFNSSLVSTEEVESIGEAEQMSDKTSLDKPASSPQQAFKS